MNSVVVIVSDEGLGGVVPFGRAVQQSGHTPILLTGRVPEERLEAWRAVYADIQVLDDPYDSQLLVDRATQAVDGRPILALFSCYDGLVISAAQAAKALGLPHPAIIGLQRSRNKYASRVMTHRCGLPTPRFSLVSSKSDCARAATNTGFPAIIKPLNGMASHLVRRVESIAALRTAYEELTSRVDQSFLGNYSRPVRVDDDRDVTLMYDPRTTFLVEEFLEGVEYSAEVIVRDGEIQRIALFHKFLVEPNGFLECGFTCPALGPDPDRAEAIWCYIEDCLSALGVDQSAAHVEIIDTPAGPFLVEVNAGRAGGQILVRAVRNMLGIDLIAEILALQSGRSRPAVSVPTLRGRVTTLTVFPPASGRIDRLEGLDEVAKLPGVIEVIPFCGPGDIVDVRDKEFFAVNLLVAGIDGDALRSLYWQACQLVRFTMTPLNG